VADGERSHYPPHCHPAVGRFLDWGGFPREAGHFAGGGGKRVTPQLTVELVNRNTCLERYLPENAEWRENQKD
jgi:hypothetical protein